MTTERQKQNKPDLWIDHDRQLFSASSVTIKSTGEVIKLDHNLKAVFSYMIDQYNSYRSDKKAFYEDQRDIAAVCDVSPRTVYSALQALVKMGLLIIKGSKKSHSYALLCVSKVSHNLEFTYKTKLNGEPAYNHKKAMENLIRGKGKAYAKILASESAQHGTGDQLDLPIERSGSVGGDGVNELPVFDFDQEIPY
ncbi:hypothetical protein QFX71_001780 [Citrobacter amalonaticus]|nr:hypothetical protein [Citrobacter amalonaticus]